MLANEVTDWHFKVQDDLSIAATPSFDTAMRAVINLDAYYARYKRGRNLDEVCLSFIADVKSQVSMVPKAVDMDLFSIQRENLDAMKPLLRLQINARLDVPASLDGVVLDADKRTAGEPWNFGLTRFVAIDRSPALSYVTLHDLATWGVTYDDLYPIAEAATRDALASTRPTFQSVTNGVMTTIWDNDVPGYCASRAYFPQLLGPAPAPDRRCLVLVHDRDLLCRFDFPRDLQHYAYLQIGMVIMERQNYAHTLLGNNPLELLPDGTLVDSMLTISAIAGGSIEAVKRQARWL